MDRVLSRCNASLRVACAHPAGSTPYETRDNVDRAGRWEFQGELAPAVVRNRYFGQKVSDYFSCGAQSPVAYVNC